MTTANARLEDAPVVEESRATRIARFAAKTPISIFLVAVGILWLVPTFGLLVTSLIDPTDIISQGWWQVFSEPSKLTFENYQAIFENETITSSLLTTFWIAIGGTLLPILVGALAGYAFAWLEFPGRDWLFIIVVGLLVVPLQMAMIPIFSLYNDVGIFDTVISLVLFHTAFGLPFAIFLLRNFFIGIQKGHARGRPDRRCLRDPDLRSPHSPARTARDRIARNLPVPVDMERPAGRPDVRA